MKLLVDLVTTDYGLVATAVTLMTIGMAARQLARPEKYIQPGACLKMTLNNQPDAGEREVLAMAMSWHEEWKQKLRAAVVGNLKIDKTLLERDDCCELGKWIYTEGSKRYWSKPEFQSLLLNHKEFHMLAGAVADVVNSKKFDLAKAYLSEDTQLAQSSREVNDSLRCLQDSLARPASPPFH